MLFIGFHCFFVGPSLVFHLFIFVVFSFLFLRFSFFFEFKIVVHLWCFGYQCFCSLVFFAFLVLFWFSCFSRWFSVVSGGILNSKIKTWKTGQHYKFQRVAT